MDAAIGFGDDFAEFEPALREAFADAAPIEVSRGLPESGTGATRNHGRVRPRLAARVG